MVPSLLLSSVSIWNLAYIVQRLTALYSISLESFSKNLVQSGVDAKWEGDENPLSGDIAETMKLLVNSFYQIMDKSRHTITKYLNDEKTHKAINELLFKRLNTVQEDSYEIELLKSTIEHKEIVGFFILQYANLRMHELYCNFFDKFCDVNQFEELKRKTDSLYLALAEENLYDCVRPEKKSDREKLRENDCRDSFRAEIQKQIVFHEHVVAFTRNTINESLDSSKKSLGVRRCYVFCSKTYCCYNNKSGKMKFSSKGLNKRVLEESGYGLTEKQRKVFDEAINLTLTNRGFRTINHTFATYEQTKKGLSFFDPKRQVQDDGIHTKPLN